MPRSIVTRVARIEIRLAANSAHGTVLDVEPRDDDPESIDRATQAALDEAEQKGLPQPYVCVFVPKSAESIEEWEREFGWLASRVNDSGWPSRAEEDAPQATSV